MKKEREESIVKEKKKNTIEAVLQKKKIDMELDEAFERCGAASGTDCTGSVPAAPVTMEQWNNYDTAHHFQPQPVKEENR